VNWRWLWFDYVDPDLPLTAEQRRTIRRRVRAMRRGFRAGFNRWDAAETLLIAAGVVVFLMCWYLLFGIRGSLLRFLLVYIPVIWVWQALVMRYTRRPWSLRAVREAGYDVCLQCGYWLRGLGDDVRVCPECGAQREPMPAAPADQQE
jgi:hypothetical protein